MKKAKRNYIQMINNYDENRDEFKIIPAKIKGLPKLSYKDIITEDILKKIHINNNTYKNLNINLLYNNIDINTIIIYITKIQDIAKTNIPKNFFMKLR